MDQKKEVIAKYELGGGGGRKIIFVDTSKL